MWRFAWVALIVGCNGSEDPKDPKDPVDPGGDVDQDGFDADDCDDADASVHPGADEAPYDGVDQDCADGDLIDVDLDGFDAEQAGGDDCDDLDPEIHPGVEDVPYDDIDQDCDGGDKVDLDGDGFGADDCDDADPTIFPAADDTPYDGIDQDCRANCDYDADHDGAVSPEWIGAVTDGSVCDRDPGPDIGVRSDCDDTDAGASTQALVGSEPADGSVGWDGFDPVRIEFADREQTIRIEMFDPDGERVFTSAGPWTPTVWEVTLYDPLTGVGPYPMRADTTYRLEIDHSCGHETITFTTGEGLGPVETDDLVGQVWQLQPWSYGWFDFAVTEYFNANVLGLLSVTASDGDTVDLRWAVPGRNGEQDLCVPTVEVPGVDFSNNPFLAADFDYPLTVTGAGGAIYSFPHMDGRVDATFYADSVFSATLSGTVETHAVTAAAGVAPNQVCTNYGCIACPDGTQTCIEEGLMIDGPFEVSGLTLVPRTAEEIALDPACP